MEIKVKYLKAMLSELLMLTDQPESQKGFKIIGEEVGGLGENYLYTKIYLPSREADSEHIIRFHDASISRILQYLGYESLNNLIQKVDHPIEPQLLNCLGSYYSYVRRSLDAGTLFRSPVLIHQKNGKVLMELRGGRLRYEGNVNLRRGVLFIPLNSGVGKSFYHVYQIGESQAPEVLQGTFSGVSNNFEPIAGRAVLIKSHKAFEELENAELEIEKLKGSESLDERRLAEYFSKRSENNLVLNRAYTFDNRDLGNCP